MYLVSLELKNFRAIHQMSLDFCDVAGETRRWTVLLGENGCGKSSVLKAIGLLLAGSEALPDLLGLPDQWIRTGAQEAELKAVIRNMQGEQRNVSLRLLRGDGRDMVIRRNEEGLRELDSAIRNSNNRNYFIAGYGAYRRPPDAEKSRHFPSGRSGPLATLFSASQDLVSLEQWAMDVDYRSKGNTGTKTIAEALNQLLPGMTFKHIDKSLRAVIMTTDDGDVPLRQLSEGYQSMAAWAGDLLFRMTETFRDHKNPLDARGLLLLDEMDLHLHPVWKRCLVDYLTNAFPRLQIVATTHSPLSVQECGEGQLFVVKRENKEPVLIPFVGDPSRMRLSELFLSPLIGLDTLDSPRISKLRDAARTIELRPGKRTAGELKQLDHLKLELSGTVPLDPREVPSFAGLIRKSQSRSNALPSKLIRETDVLFRYGKDVKGVPQTSPATGTSSMSLKSLPKRIVAKARDVMKATAAKKAPAKKAVAKKVVAKKAVAKKVATKKAVAKKAVARKVAIKK
jgi:predicted ATP-binding protein involved in virulence